MVHEVPGRRREFRGAETSSIPERLDDFVKKLMEPQHGKSWSEVWWSAAGLIHHRFLGPGQEITTESFNKELELVHERLQTQQPAPSHRKNPIFLYDTSRAHVEKTTLQKLHRLGVEVLPHPSYSPDLLPTEFHFFHALDKFIKEKRFRDGDELKDAFKQFLDSLDSDFYKDGEPDGWNVKDGANQKVDINIKP
ncbi:hypothetical protein ANCCAN_13673 [Ancylostoma caninum]|uniref:Tc1-like transposase DDE domain-containing protein n=1 Tax=Ancylostoma caninum TaxID=29170 RepID=A0A368G7Q5_ANCCA|nr:hypothetical protein ANCCAN_13673 [Ancylostoma caninum]